MDLIVNCIQFKKFVRWKVSQKKIFRLKYEEIKEWKIKKGDMRERRVCDKYGKIFVIRVVEEEKKYLKR